MATVGVVGSSLQADSQPKSVGLVWGLVVGWRSVLFIAWTEWTLSLAMSSCYADNTIQGAPKKIFPRKNPISLEL